MSSPSGASFSLRCLIYKVHAVPGGTLLLYSISFRLSRTFFRSFLTSDPSCISSNLFRLPHLSLAVKNFFHFFPAWLITAPTALLEYQILPLLSIPFSRFFYFSDCCGDFSGFRPLPLAQVGKISCANGGDSGIMSMEIKCIHSRRD